MWSIFDVRRAFVSAMAGTVLLAGCTTGPIRGSALAACDARFEELDAQLREAGLMDAQARRIPGFAYLRVDRFLASYADEPLDGAAFSAWVDRLRQRARRGRAIELSLLYHHPAQAQSVQDRLEDCATRMLARDMMQPRRREQLRRRARVPDDYRDTARIAGLYPLVLPVLKAGVARWKSQMRSAFDTPGHTNPDHVRSYALEAQPVGPKPPLGAWLTAARSHNALGIPDLDAARLKRLEQYFAPVWTIDTTASYDHPGIPYRKHAALAVDSRRPRVYVQPAYTRFDGAVLLQLAYIIWFSERPRHGWIDPLAGSLDGVILRVTLDRDGMPLLYDSIHPCGCYQMFFPTHRLQEIGDNSFWTEGALVPAAAPSTVPIVVDLASATHYIRSVETLASQPTNPQRYRLTQYRALRRQKPRLFDNNGLILGSERSERWLLWPSGVISPGAMRQWGHHATAFVGQRHFDDPFLIGRYFRRRRQVTPAGK